MRYAHILTRVTGTPWLITEDALTAITDLLESRIFGANFVNSPRSVSDDGFTAQAARTWPSSRSVAVVPVHGILGKHLSGLETMCGGCDYDAVTAAVAEAFDDASVKSVVLAINSPGGTVTGCPEAHARLSELRQQSGKKLYAFSDTQACSAAFYLAAACDGVFCTAMAQIGSIGAILSFEDRSAQMAAAGVRRITFKSASMKDIGSPYRAPTNEESTELQSRIDYMGAMFCRDVQAGRPGIAAEVFEKGLTYFGAQAVAVGLSDGVVASLDALIAELES